MIEITWAAGASAALEWLELLVMFAVLLSGVKGRLESAPPVLGNVRNPEGMLAPQRDIRLRETGLA